MFDPATGRESACIGVVVIDDAGESGGEGKEEESDGQRRVIRSKASMFFWGDACRPCSLPPLRGRAARPCWTASRCRGTHHVDKDVICALAPLLLYRRKVRMGFRGGVGARRWRDGGRDETEVRRCRLALGGAGRQRCGAEWIGGGVTGETDEWQLSEFVWER